MAALELNSKTITVTLPGDLARKLEILAEREGRDASDIVAEAVQALWADRVDKLFAETRTYAATRNPHGYTETDVPSRIREVREEADAQESERAIAQVARGFTIPKPHLSLIKRDSRHPREFPSEHALS